MPSIGHSSAYLLSPLSPLTPLPEDSGSGRGTPAGGASRPAAGTPPPGAGSMKDLRAELSGLKSELCDIFRDLGAKHPSSNPRAPTENELADSRLEIIRTTRQTVVASVSYPVAGPDGGVTRASRMLTGTAEQFKTAEAGLARCKELEDSLRRMPDPRPASYSGGKGAMKRRLSYSSHSGSSDGGRRTSPLGSAPNPRSSPRSHAQLRKEALAVTLENQVPPGIRAELQAMAGAEARAGERLMEILEHGADSGIIGGQHADALDLPADLDHRFVAGQIGEKLACLLVAGPAGLLPAAARQFKWVTLGTPVAMQQGSAVPAWVDGRKIFLHVAGEGRQITGIRVLADALHALPPEDPVHADIRAFLARAEVIDRLYPPTSAPAAPGTRPSAVELALRNYDVAEALRLLGVMPRAGTLHEVDMNTAAQVCNAAIGRRDLDALCAMLVVQPVGFVDQMQAATNKTTGRSLRDEVMELAGKMDRPALRHYLKQFPYPYHSKQGDARIRLNGEATYMQEGYAGDPITCRDLATAWLRERMPSAAGKADYSRFSSVEALEELDPVQLHSERRLMFASARQRYLVHLQDFGKVLEQLFKSMEKASAEGAPGEKRKTLFIVNTDTHVLAGFCSVTGEPPAYRVVVYDPNATATHKTATTASLSAVGGWQLPSLYLHGQLQNYHIFEEKIIGVHVLPDTLAPSAQAHEQPPGVTIHHNWIVDMSAPDWIDRLTPLQMDAMLANGLHEDWREIMHSLPRSFPRERLKDLLAASSRAIYNKVQVLDFTETLRTYMRTIGSLAMIDDTTKFQLISNASQSEDKDDYPSPGYLAAYLDEVMDLPLSEEMRVRLVMPEVHPDERDMSPPYLHTLAQRLQAELVHTTLDRVEAMPISDANKLRIIAAADSEGRTAITHPMDENMPELVERFIGAIMRLDVPDEHKAAVIFNAIPRGMTKEQVLHGIGLPADGPNIARLLHEAMSQLTIPDAYKDSLFMPRPAHDGSGSDDSDRTD